MGKYRQKGESYNSMCTYCEAPIWTSSGSGVYTTYTGKAHYWNDSSISEPCSFDILEKDSPIIKSACPDCFNNKFKDTSNEA